MMAIRATSLFRPIARPEPAQPAVVAPTAVPFPPPTPMETSLSNGSERASRPLNKITMGLRRATPAPSLSRASSPAPLVQDGTYLDALSLKLSEAVSKALAQPTGPVLPGELLAGRRPIPVGRGTALGALIASELNAAAGNSNLRRAIVRALQRPLSVLRTNIATNLLPLISSPAFLTPAIPSVQAPNPTPTQLHALAYATFAGELVEAFNEMGLGAELDSRDNNLRAVKEDMASMVGRVVGPLFGAMKTELCPIIEALEYGAAGPASSAVKTSKPVIVHPSVATLQAIMPVYAKTLTRYAATPTAHTHLASLLISLAWRGLVALSAREPAAASMPPTPKMAALALGQKKPRQLSNTSPPATPPSARFMLKLPPSRPPSPPNAAAQAAKATAAGDAKALFDLLNTLPRPAADKEATKLAKEAVDEVFDALRALVDLMDATLVATKAIREGRDANVAEVCEKIDEDLPTLIALPILLRAFVFTETAPLGEGGQPPRTVAELLGMKDEAYRVGFLHGFGRAEEYAPAVGARVLDVLAMPRWKEAMSTPNAKVVETWLARRVEEDAEDATAH